MRLKFFLWHSGTFLICGPTVVVFHQMDQTETTENGSSPEGSREGKDHVTAGRGIESVTGGRDMWGGQEDCDEAQEEVPGAITGGSGCIQDT